MDKLLITFFSYKYHRALKILKDEGISVAPPRRKAHPAPIPSADSTPEPTPAPVSASVSAPVPAPVAASVPASIIEPTPTSASSALIPAGDLGMEDIQPQGSSRATGGFLRGRAAANYYSPADEENTISGSIGAAKLITKIYTSNLDPVNLHFDTMVPSAKVTIKMNPSLGPILDSISQRYPAIQGMY